MPGDGHEPSDHDRVGGSALTFRLADGFVALPLAAPATEDDPAWQQFVRELFPGGHDGLWRRAAEWYASVGAMTRASGVVGVAMVMRRVETPDSSRVCSAHLTVSLLASTHPGAAVAAEGIYRAQVQADADETSGVESSWSEQVRYGGVTGTRTPTRLVLPLRWSSGPAVAVMRARRVSVGGGEDAVRGTVTLGQSEVYVPNPHGPGVALLTMVTPEPADLSAYTADLARMAQTVSFAAQTGVEGEAGAAGEGMLPQG